MKQCAKCKSEKPRNEFYKDKVLKDGLTSYCKACIKSASIQWGQQNRNRKNTREKKRRDENPRINKETPLRRFNLTTEDYSALSDFQEGVCAICKKPETVARKGKLKRLAIDHDHSTGRIRGLLCAKCNSMLGLAQDDVSILENAIKYLRFGYLNTLIPLGDFKQCKVSV